MIKFGTDGWRAILDKDFTAQNVEKVTLAIGKYVFDNFGLNKTIIVGYDPRRMADEYALQCATTLAKKGFKVKLSSRVLPTPVLAYNAKLLNASAIMFTASHNPADYLGMKFIPEYAGPATSKITDEIVSNIDKDFASQEGRSVEKVDNKWQEIWTIKACSKTALVPINFELNEKGGTYGIDPMKVQVLSND